VLAVVVVSVFIGYNKASEGLDVAISSVDDVDIKDNLNTSSQHFRNDSQRFNSFWDALFLLIIFGTWLGMFITSWSTKTSSIFLVIFVLLSISFIVVAIVFSTVGANLVDSGSLTPYFDSFPIMAFVLKNFIYYALFFIFSIGFALYSKNE